jgi:hypothetical protein
LSGFRHPGTLNRMKVARSEDPLSEFREQCRRQLERRLEDRIKYGFCLVYKPVLDDAPHRAFETMAEYRAWCEANLPEYLGFRQASKRAS